MYHVFIGLLCDSLLCLWQYVCDVCTLQKREVGVYVEAGHVAINSGRQIDECLSIDIRSATGAVALHYLHITGLHVEIEAQVRNGPCIHGAVD